MTVEQLRGESMDLYRRLRPGMTTTATHKALREVILATDNALLLNGHLWRVKSKRVGPGVYEVGLELRNK